MLNQQEEHHSRNDDNDREQQASNEAMWLYPRSDLTEEEAIKLRNMLAFVQEGIVKVNMMILTCTVLWKECTWNAHPDSVDAMVQCASLHFLEVINVFQEYLRVGYHWRPCIANDSSPYTTTNAMPRWKGEEEY